MPIVIPQAIVGQGVQSLSVDDGPKGLRPMFFYDTKGRGVPRWENLILMRVLEQTHTVSLPMKTIIGQITTTPFTIRPTVDEPTDEHWQACQDAYDWLDGNYNRNHDTFEHLMKQVVRDILSIDAGIIELVPEEEGGYLAEMYARDGATFVKNPDIHGTLPPPGPEEEPAYFQFSLPGAMGALSTFSRRGAPSISELMEGLYGEMAMRFSYGFSRPIAFTKDQIVWFEENPRTWSPYGYGRVQIVQRVVELLLNQDLSNKKYFTANDIPEGVLSLVDANSAQITRFQTDWKAQMHGKVHKVAIVNGKLEWIKFREPLKDLQFLESQKWYNQLTWMCFGLSQNEVGDPSDVNRNTADNQTVTIWRKTTKPMLSLIEKRFNGSVLPYMEPYHRVDGEIEFAYVPENPVVEVLEREMQREDLQLGLITINEVRLERGLDEYAWGDWPPALIDAVARGQPEWFLGELLGVEHPPEALPSFPGLFDYRGEVHRGVSVECECISCGHKLSSEKHCTEIECPKCGGEMRRAERPGPGKTPTEDVDDGGLRLALKEALRNEPAHEYPPLVAHILRLQKRLSSLIETHIDAIMPLVRQEFPKEREEEEEEKAVTKVPLINIMSIVNQIVFAKPMLRLVLGAHKEGLEESIVFHQNRVEQELKERLGEDYEPLAMIRVEDTNALRQLQEAAAQHMTNVEEEVREQVRHVLLDVQAKGGNVQDATTALRKWVPEISKSRASLVARTEILGAARYGSQTLADSTDLIAGKGWYSTQDNRTRAWHAKMHKTIVPKDAEFVVPQLGAKGQPKDYPRTTFVVGGDQPFNCRCDQRCILREDLPKTPKALMAKYPEIKVLELNDRMREVLQLHGHPGETLRHLLRRSLWESGGVGGSGGRAPKSIGIAKSTFYSWMDLCGLK